MRAEIHNLLVDFWHDFDRADGFWQIGVLIICLAIPHLIDRFLRDRRAADPALSQISLKRRAGVRSVGRPLVAILLVIGAREILGNWYPVNLLSIAIPLLFAAAVIRAVCFVLRYNFRSAPWIADIERGIGILAWFLVFLHIVGLLPQVIDLLEAVSFPVGKQKLNLWLLSQGIVTVIATMLVALWLSGLVDARLMKAEGLDSNLRVVFSRISKAILVLLAILVALPLVGLDITTLSVFGGAVGVGLGFGMQKIASNYVAGFIILLDRSIRLGNTITVGGQRGKVTHITTRYTVLRNAEGNEFIVPNETIIGSTVTSEAYAHARMKVTLRVRVTYTSDLERAMSLMEEVAKAQDDVLEKPAPVAAAVEFTDLGIWIELAYWIVEPERGGWQQLRSDISVAIWKAFKEASIELH